MENSIRKYFSEVPNTYEMVNHVITCFMNIIWRKKAAKVAAAGGGTIWLDVCSGTGEMAINLSRLAADKNVTVIASDFSLPMIKKAIIKPEACQIKFTLSDTSTLPFRDRTFDLVTISFAIRNLNVTHDTLVKSFKEICRVLKPGGRFVGLETSQPQSRLIRWLVHLYVRTTVKPIGYLISGSKDSYAYLSQSISSFYTADELADIIRQAGFTKVNFQHMMFGVVAIHKAVK